MDTFVNGHEVQLNNLDDFEFSDPANKWKNWTGECSRIDSRSKQWSAPAGQAPSTLDWLSITQVTDDDCTRWASWLNTQQVS
jgi:hypothetical protein